VILRILTAEDTYIHYNNNYKLRILGVTLSDPFCVPPSLPSPRLTLPQTNPVPVPFRSMFPQGPSGLGGNRDLGLRSVDTPRISIGPAGYHSNFEQALSAFGL